MSDDDWWKDDNLTLVGEGKKKLEHVSLLTNKYCPKCKKNTCSIFFGWVNGGGVGELRCSSCGIGFKYQRIIPREAWRIDRQVRIDFGGNLYLNFINSIRNENKQTTIKHYSDQKAIEDKKA